MQLRLIVVNQIHLIEMSETAKVAPAPEPDVEAAPRPKASAMGELAGRPAGLERAGAELDLLVEEEATA